MGGTGPEGPPERARGNNTSAPARPEGGDQTVRAGGSPRELPVSGGAARAGGARDAARVWAEVCDRASESLVLRQLMPRMGVAEIVERGDLVRLVVRCEPEVRTLAEASRARLEALVAQVVDARAEIVWAAQIGARSHDASGNAPSGGPGIAAASGDGGGGAAGGEPPVGDHPLVAAAVRVFAGTVVRIDRKERVDRGAPSVASGDADAEREGARDV